MRKIPRLGLLVGLLLVGALVVAALPATVLAVQELPWPCVGDVTLDDADAPVDTVIDVYLGTDADPILTMTVTIPGEYGQELFWAAPSRWGEAVRYEVDTFPATTVPASPVFGSLFYAVDLTALSEEAPEVTTDPATSVHHNSATLNGYLDTLGEFTSVDVYFEYGTDTGYGDTTSPVTKSITGSFSAPTSSTLDPDTEYHYRAVGGYDSKDAVGLDETFTTLAEPVWPYELRLGDGLNIISTPVWLDSASDTVADIIPTGYNVGYRWTGTSFTSLSTSYVWKPLEAFYVYVDAGTDATFVPTPDRKAPNTRTLASNRWYLIGSSPFGGSGCQTIDDVLVNLVSNWSVVVKPTAANQTGASCTVNNPTALTLCAYEGAFVYVGAGATRTIVGFCTTPVD